MANKNLLISIGLNIQKAVNSCNILSRSFNLMGSTIAAVWRTAVVAGFFNAIRAGVQTIQNLKNALVSTVSSMAELNLAAIRTAATISEGGAGFGQAFESTSELARRLSTEVNASAQQIQEGLFTAAQAALNLKDSFSTVRSALQLSSVAGEEFQTTLNSLIGVSRAFNVSAENIGQMADTIYGASVKSKATVQDLFEGLKNVAAISGTAFGQTKDSFLDATAALMTMNDAGIEGSTAGVKLRAAMQKLMGGTAQSTAAFAKYGVNLFEANGASQKFLGTLIKSQKAYGKNDETLNKLKKSQFDLAIAGRTGSEEYANIEEKIQEVEKSMASLEGGMNNVYDSFVMAGGKLKPFGTILDDIKKKMPTEVVGRVFGVRGGEGIMRILQDLDKFKDFRAKVDEYYAESEKGNGILANTFAQFFTSVLMQWQKLKNTGMASISVIADAAFGAFSGLFKPIQTAFDLIYQNVEKNKAIFAKLFEGIADAVKPALTAFSMGIGDVFAEMQKIFLKGSSIKVNKYSFNKETGKVEAQATTVSGSSSQKMKAWADSLGSLLFASLQATLTALKPVFGDIATFFGQVFFTYFEGQIEIIKNVLLPVGKEFGSVIVQVIKAELPGLLAYIRSLVPALGRVIPKDIESKAAMTGSKALGSNEPAAAIAAKAGLSAGLNGFNQAPNPAQSMLDKVFGGAPELNSAATNLTGVGDKFLASVDSLSSAVKAVDSKADKALSIATTSVRAGVRK